MTGTSTSTPTTVASAARALVPLLPDYGTPELEIVALYPHRRQLSTKVRSSSTCWSTGSPKSAGGLVPRPIGNTGVAAFGVRRAKAALSSGCKAHPAIRSSRKQSEQSWR